MKNVTVSRIHDFYDVPQVIEAIDDIGGHYVGVYVEGSQTLGDYVLVGATPENLRKFRAGAIDLRSLMIHRPGESGWFYAGYAANGSERMVLSSEQAQVIPDECLPSEGYFLRRPQSTESIVIQAKEADRLVMSVTVEPPEAVENHKIKAESLGELLLALQRVCSHAYAYWRRTEEGLKENYGKVFNITVLGLAPSSVKVMMEAETTSNALFPEYGTGRAMDIVSDLFNTPDRPDETAQTVQKYKGHLATAYRDLLDVLIEQDSKFELNWATPDSESATSRSMSVNEAKMTQLRLSMISSLGSEEVVIEGRLRGADEGPGTWTLITDSGPRSGKTVSGGEDASGLTIGRRYRFICDEILERKGTGKEQQVLQLKRSEPLQEVEDDVE